VRVAKPHQDSAVLVDGQVLRFNELSFERFQVIISEVKPYLEG
jgi:hypothetical protein